MEALKPCRRRKRKKKKEEEWAEVKKGKKRGEQWLLDERVCRPWATRSFSILSAILLLHLCISQFLCISLCPRVCFVVSDILEAFIDLLY